MWYVTDAVSEEAAKLAGKRRHARGRTSTLKKVQWAAKRQALQMTSLDTALSKLKALSAGPALTLARRRQA